MSLAVRCGDASASGFPASQATEATGQNAILDSALLGIVGCLNEGKGRRVLSLTGACMQHYGACLPAVHSLLAGANGAKHRYK